jgi:hypothetical protein
MNERGFIRFHDPKIGEAVTKLLKNKTEENNIVKRCCGRVRTYSWFI